MKKLLSIILVFIFLFTTLLTNTLSVNADNLSKDFNYSVRNGEALIYQILLSGDVKIPKKIDGYPVTSISTDDCPPKSITSLTIPEGVKYISYYSFKDCTNLSEITLPDSIEHIGTDAFKDTGYYDDESNWKNGVLYIGKHLVAVKKSISGECKIKEGTLTIAEQAFANCDRLTKLTIPKSVKNLGSNLFLNCAELDIITVSSDNKYFSAKDAIIYNKNKTEVICASGGIFGEITLPKTVKTIRDSAFQNCDMITRIKLPNGLEKIDNKAFYACDSLEKINIPDSVKSVGSHILHGSKYYYTKANWDGSFLYVGKHLLQHDDWNQPKGEYTVKEGTLTIADSTFSYCDKLKKITIPDSVVYLGRSAFSECYNLKSVTLSKNLTAINSATFSNCSKIEKIKLPKGIKEIGAYAFSDCRELKELNIPENVTKIGEGAFAECKVLPEVTIPAKVKKIEASTFSDCESIKEIKLPSGVTEIGSSAFKNCILLKKITLPKAVKKIGTQAFERCGKLTSIIYIGTKSDHKKIKIDKDNYYLTTVPWTYKPEKESTVSTTGSQKTETKTEEPQNETEANTSLESEIEIENTQEIETEESNMKIPEVKKQNNKWIALLFVGAVALGIGGGISAFALTNKKKNK